MKTLVLFRTLVRDFKRFGSLESNCNSPLSSTGTSKEVAVLRVVFLVVLATMK
jgi:hypothetical protein